MRSMTGFGSAKENFQEVEFTVEIQSVNKKFLEVAVFLPKDFFSFELEAKKVISDEILRGYVTVRINLSAKSSMLSFVLPDKASFKRWKSDLEGFAKDVGCEESLSFAFLLEQLQKVPQIRDLEPLKPKLVQAIKNALKNLILAKEIEGKALLKDLKDRNAEIEQELKKIEEKAPQMIALYRKKLQDRLEELFTKKDEIEDKLLKEAALFADKVDITEELVRFRIHAKKFEKLLSSSAVSIGRELDFILQEMGREIHTLSAKSLDAEIGSHAVFIKSALEKQREQVQNVE